MKYHRIRPRILENARQLRREQSPIEAILWKRIRSQQLNGLKFRRQYPVGNYIIDFYCPALKLAIELDGDSHNEQINYDETRTLWLNQQGIEVLRFTNQEVVQNLDGVLEMILQKTKPLEK